MEQFFVTRVNTKEKYFVLDGSPDPHMESETSLYRWGVGLEKIFSRLFTVIYLQF